MTARQRKKKKKKKTEAVINRRANPGYYRIKSFSGCAFRPLRQTPEVKQTVLYLHAFFFLSLVPSATLCPFLIRLMALERWKSLIVRAM